MHLFLWTKRGRPAPRCLLLIACRSSSSQIPAYSDISETAASLRDPFFPSTPSNKWLGRHGCVQQTSNRERDSPACIFIENQFQKKKKNTELAECFNRVKRRRRGGGGVIGEGLRHFIGKSAHLYVSGPLVMEMQMSSTVYFLHRGNDRSTGQKKRKKNFPRRHALKKIS